MRLRLWHALSIPEHLVVSEIFRTKPGILCDLCQCCRPDFLIGVKQNVKFRHLGFCSFL